MVAMGSVGGWFEPGDDVGRAWDEAEAILLACEDLDAVMETIRSAESPVEARRALKLGFGFTGRQAALLLTLPVLSFTRSERDRMHAGRRARVDLLADVTGVIPVVRDVEPEPPREAPAAEATWDAEFDGALDRIRSAMDTEAAEGNPAGHRVGVRPPANEPAGVSEASARRSRSCCRSRVRPAPGLMIPARRTVGPGCCSTAAASTIRSGSARCSGTCAGQDSTRWRACCPSRTR